MLVVARGAQALELLDDRAAVLRAPLPDAADERLAADLLAARALVEQLPLDLRLRGDAGVVGAEDPLRALPEHPVPADQRVLDRAVERVAHVQRAGDVRRRDRDRVVLRRVALGRGREQAGRQPRLDDPGLDLGGLESRSFAQVRHGRAILGAAMQADVPGAGSGRSGASRRARSRRRRTPATAAPPRSATRRVRRLAQRERPVAGGQARAHALGVEDPGLRAPVREREQPQRGEPAAAGTASRRRRVSSGSSAPERTNSGRSSTPACTCTVRPPRSARAPARDPGAVRRAVAQARRASARAAAGPSATSGPA